MNAIALVTGATQGLGLGLVQGLARQLHHGEVVYLTGRNPERLEQGRSMLARRCREQAAGARRMLVPA